MIIKRRNWRTLAEPPHGKPVKILVWKNGDFESNEQEVTLHPKYLKSWNAVLAYLTGAVQPNFGAVRKMYHLESRKLVDCLKNLTTNERYIVAGREKARFKKNGYLTKQEKLDSDTIKSPANSIHLSDHVKSLLNFMEYTKRMKRTIIYVMVSGRTCQKPIKVVLTEADLLAWNKVLEYLAYQLDVAEGVQFLCKVNGKLIFHPEDLQHGELYVAMPFNGKFVQMDYVKLFSELRPPKKVKIRKPRKIGNISLIQTKKGKTRSQHRVASSSLAVLAGSVAVVHGKCFLPKCRTKECRLQEPTVRSSNVEVQTQFSDSGDDERNLSAVHILDTNLEAYEKHYQEKQDSYVESENESLESPSENELSQDEVENRYFYDSMEIIKSILDELIDECLFELECKGKVSPQRKSLSKASVDKVFIADPAEKLSIESLDISTEHDFTNDKTEVVIKEESFDCCTENAKQKELEEKQKESKEEGDRILTTFAEIARRKQQENDKARLKKSTSRLSVESDLESGYKSVSFGSEELVQNFEIRLVKSVGDLDFVRRIMVEQFRPPFTVSKHYTGKELGVQVNHRQEKNNVAPLWKVLLLFLNAIFQW